MPTSMIRSALVSVRLRASLLRVQQLEHRQLVELEAALDARVVAQAIGLLCEQLAVAVDIAGAVEIVGLVRRLAADFRPDGVVVHERRGRPDIDQRDIAHVAATAILELVALGNVGNDLALAQGVRRRFHVQVAGLVVGVQRAATESADLGDRCRLIVAQEVGPYLARMRFAGGGEVAILERAAFALRNARMAARAVLGEDQLSAADGTGAEFAFQVADQIGAAIGHPGRTRLANIGQRRVEVGLIRLGRGKEIEHVLQAVLDGPEVRAIAPALADIRKASARNRAAPGPPRACRRDD
jgi:hypothetical protein